MRKATPVEASTSEQAKSPWKLLGRSIVMSTAGAQEQQWHADGSHIDIHTHRPCHVLNVFVPLVDITLGNGPTEIRPGSHYLTRDLARMTLLAKVKKTLRSPVKPTPRAGDALIFDYRTLHRGRANVTEEPRPVLVMTFAQSWFRDLYNFPRRSLHDAVASCDDGDMEHEGTACVDDAGLVAPQLEKDQQQHFQGESRALPEVGYVGLNADEEGGHKPSNDSEF